jgi:DNA uptake protein ComE-like DNA-binding protein
VNVNAAPLEDLLLLPGVAYASAEMLISERDRRSGFRNVEEIGSLLGFRPHETERLRSRITFQGDQSPFGRAAGRRIDF